MNASPAQRLTVSELQELLGGAPVRHVDAAALVGGLADDSRQARAGDVFFARHGTALEGAAFARDAVERGAVLVVADVDLPPDIPTLRVPDVEQALRLAADTWYGRPQDTLDLVAITGTKGKTTTAYLTAAALRRCGRPTAVLGTIAHDLGDGRPLRASNTTPGPLELRRLLAGARDAGCKAAVMEVSSHALDQGRTEGLAFRAAVFTNLGSDHLDYHRTREAYFEAKASLFASLDASGTAVLNRDDPTWTRLAARCRGSVLTFGLAPETDLRARDVRLSIDGTAFRLVVSGESEVDVRMRLIGRHNAMNLLGAVGAAMGVGLDPVMAAEGAASLAGVPGRLERVPDAAATLYAFVDYAHTEDALRQVLAFLGEVGAKPITCVIGCGGDRDASKRAPMGRAAAELADVAVFTSDNPRTEDPERILDDMLRGLADDPDAAARVLRVADRRAAIRRAVLEAAPGSTVLVAGKGHESEQIVGAQRVPFDDVEEVRDALRERAERAREGSVP